MERPIRSNWRIQKQTHNYLNLFCVYFLGVFWILLEHIEISIYIIRVEINLSYAKYI
jgi:hypothetical protein